MSKLQLGIIILLTSLALYVRATDISNHFGHCDDLTVALRIAKARTELTDSMRELRASDSKLSSLPSIRDRAWHWWVTSGPRGNVIDEITARVVASLTIPNNLTYAPFQFLFTSLLLSPELTYRQTLFWGRLPSLLVAMVAFLFFAWFYRLAYDESYFPYLVTFFALVAFSWEAIIYSKQMSSYAIGIFSVGVTLVLLGSCIRAERFTTKLALVTAAVLGMLCYTQYQVTLLVPAFYSTLLFNQVRRKMLPFREIFRQTAISTVAFLFFFLPLYFYFLRFKAGRGNNTWNIGPHGEYFFHFEDGMGFLGKLAYYIKFFFLNSIEVIQSNHSFVPPESGFFIFFSSVFCLLSVFGLWNTLRPDSPRREIGLFILFTGLTWGVMVAQGKLTLGPTRHVLILLPLSAILIAEGLGAFSSWMAPWMYRIRYRGPTFPLFVGGLAFTQAVLFFYWFPSVVQSRKDPFVPSELASAIEDSHLTLMVSDVLTHNLQLMKNDLPPIEMVRNTPENSERLRTFSGNFGWINHRTGPSESFIKSYEIVSRREIASNTEVDFLSRTRNGSNGFYFYVFKNRP